jgi:hypothetical protein
MEASGRESGLVSVRVSTRETGSPRRDLWRLRGALEGAGRSLGCEREILDAFRDGGPGNREGAGRRLLARSKGS